jgi:hypothetical protein
MAFVCKSNAMKFFNDKHFSLSPNLKPYLSQIVTESHNTFVLHPYALLPKKHPLFGGRQVIQILLEFLLITLIRESQEIVVVTSKNDMTNSLVQQIIYILEENLYNKINIDYIAKKMNYKFEEVVKTSRKY